MTQKELKDALDILDQAKTTLHGSLVKGWGPAHDDARNRLQKGTLTEATTERIKEHYFQWWKKTIDRWAVEQQDLARSNAEHAQRYPPWGSKPSATWTVGPVDDLLKENEVAASLFMVAMKAELAAGPEFKKVKRHPHRLPFNDKRRPADQAVWGTSERHRRSGYCP
jgi:hypothetical protein